MKYRSRDEIGRASCRGRAKHAQRGIGLSALHSAQNQEAQPPLQQPAPPLPRDGRPGPARALLTVLREMQQAAREVAVPLMGTENLAGVGYAPCVPPSGLPLAPQYEQFRDTRNTPTGSTPR